MHSNNIGNFQESTIILHACTKKSGNILKAPGTSVERRYKYTRKRLKKKRKRKKKSREITIRWQGWA